MWLYCAYNVGKMFHNFLVSILGYLFAVSTCRRICHHPSMDEVIGNPYLNWSTSTSSFGFGQFLLLLYLYSLLIISTRLYLLIIAFSLRPFNIPLVDQCAGAILFIWVPSNDKEPVIRILYPGSCPQDKIFQGLEKLKHLDCLHYRTCSQAFLSQPASKRTTSGLTGLVKSHRG